LEKREDELVWMQGKERRKRHAYREEKYSKRRKGGAAQRGKGTAKWRMVRRTGKHSKRERKRCAHKEEKRSERGG